MGGDWGADDEVEVGARLGQSKGRAVYCIYRNRPAMQKVGDAKACGFEPGVFS